MMTGFSFFFAFRIIYGCNISVKPGTKSVNFLGEIMQKLEDLSIPYPEGHEKLLKRCSFRLNIYNLNQLLTMWYYMKK